MLFKEFEFNWQKTNRSFAKSPLWHTFGNTLYLFGLWLTLTQHPQINSAHP